MTLFTHGWNRDHLDPRDKLFSSSAIKLPIKVDLESILPAVYDQGQLGSCTAHASACLLEAAQMRQGEAEGRLTPSRLFIYHQTKVLEGSPLNQDTGAQVRSAIKVLNIYGAPAEELYPYSDLNPGPYSNTPPSSVVAQAVQWESIQYHKILIGSPGMPMRAALDQKLPIAFGFVVPDYFEGSWDPTSEYLPLPTSSTQYIGGHAVCVVGYDYSRTIFPVPVFKVRNSWSSNWGINGYFWIDARWFDTYRQLASDLWVVSKVK